jgi:hypothetical protein
MPNGRPEVRRFTALPEQTFFLLVAFSWRQFDLFHGVSSLLANGPSGYFGAPWAFAMWVSGTPQCRKSVRIDGHFCQRATTRYDTHY